MKSISLNSILGYFQRRVDLVFTLGLAVFFCVTIYAMIASVQLVMTVNNPVEAIKQNKDVRVDFKEYDKAVKIIQDGQNYQADIPDVQNPFQAMIKPQ